MKETKTFFLNGEEYFSDKIINLLDIINYFNYNSSLLVLEYNNFICPKKDWNNIFIIGTIIWWRSTKNSK